MGTMIQDLRYGLRTLAKSPGFTVVAVTALALGIGANTAIFSVVNAALLRPLPYRDSERLVMVWEQLLKLGLDRFPATFGDYFDYRDQNAVFEDIAAFEYANLDLTGSEQPERLLAMRASANLFPLLGRKAALGRTFVPEENQPGRDAVVVLSDALWRRRFGADPSLVGKTVSLDGNPFTVVGVMPAGFRFSIDGSSSPDVWAPIAFHPDPARTAGGLRMIARLKPGVSTERAGTDMKTIAARLAQQYHVYRGPRGEDAGYDVIVVPLREQLFGDVRRGLLVLLGAVGLVLLIACANVANLLLARATARQKEMAIRVAVGAGRLRLVRQLLTESVLLGLMGGCLGLILAFWGVDVLVSLSPNSVSSIVDVGIDGQALAFTLVIALVTGLIFGLAPALQVSRIDLNESLKVAGRSPAAGIGSRVRQLLVVGEVALSLMLVVGSGLLIKSFIRLRAVHPGFNAEKLITAQISLSPSRFRQNHQMTAFYRQLLDRIATLPEVKSASVVSALPLSEGGGGDPFSIDGRPWRPFDPATRTPQVVSHQAIGLDYFRTMQIPLRAGRRFTERDSEGALPVVVVNETMARGFWARENVIGKRIMLGAPRPGAPWLTIVGVVGDVRSSGLEVAPIPQMYTPYLQNPSASMTLVIRSASDASSVIAAARSEVFALDKEQPLYNVATMGQRLSGSVAPRRFNTLLFGAFAALALVLAAVGIYGVISYSVTLRTREVGIRMALGARRHDVLRLVVEEGMLLGLAGIALGLIGAAALTRVMSSLLYDVRPTDPATFVEVSLLLAGVALLASYVPARRATKVDPMVALRHE